MMLHLKISSPQFKNQGIQTEGMADQNDQEKAKYLTNVTRSTGKLEVGPKVLSSILEISSYSEAMYYWPPKHQLSRLERQIRLHKTTYSFRVLCPQNHFDPDHHLSFEKKILHLSVIM